MHRLTNTPENRMPLAVPIVGGGDKKPSLFNTAADGCINDTEQCNVSTLNKS